MPPPKKNVFLSNRWKCTVQACTRFSLHPSGSKGRGCVLTMCKPAPQNPHKSNRCGRAATRSSHPPPPARVHQSLTSVHPSIRPPKALLLGPSSSYTRQSARITGVPGLSVPATPRPSQTSNRCGRTPPLRARAAKALLPIKTKVSQQALTA